MTAPPKAEWRREGTGFPVAPPAVEQPQPVPARPRAGGAPYTTPRVRAEAGARGVGIPAVAAGSRVRIEDLPPATTTPAEDTAPAPARAAGVAAAAGVAGHVAAVEVDVTALRRALGGNPAGPVWSAVLARVAARRQAAVAGLGTGLGLRIGEAAGVVAVPDARLLSLAGLLARIEEGPGAEGTPDLVLTHSGAAGLAWELTPPPAGARVSLTAGAVDRRVQVVEVEGAESFAARSVLSLVLVHDDRTDRTAALQFLTGVRGDLESLDPARVVAELP